MTRGWLLVLCLVMTPLPLQAQPKVGIGLYAPEIRFTRPAERYALIRGVAQHLSKAISREVVGRAYKAAGDFRRDIRAGKLQLAIVGGGYAAKNAGLKLLARARMRSRGDTTWSILARRKLGIAELKGKVLQVPRLGLSGQKLVQNAVLAGAVKVARHFKLRYSPDLNSAIAAVKLGKAAAVVGPVSTAGLTPVIDGIQVPPPVLVVVASGLSSELVSKARASMLSYGGVVASIVGWQPARPGPYRALAAAARGRTYELKLVPAPAASVSMDKLVDRRGLEPRLPPMEDIFWIP